MSNCGLCAFLQVALLKKRVKGVSDGAVPLEGDNPQTDDVSDSSRQSPSKEQGEEPEVAEGVHSAKINLLSVKCIQESFLLRVMFCFADRRGQQ